MNSAPIRKALREFSYQVYEKALPLILVFSVATLEKFLRSIWEERFGAIEKNLRRVFSDPKEFAKALKQRVQKEMGPLTFKANAVAMKRHVLLHKEGVVDPDALEVFREAGISDVKLGEKLRLTAESVERDMNTILEFAKKVKEVIYFDSETAEAN